MIRLDFHSARLTSGLFMSPYRWVRSLAAKHLASAFVGVSAALSLFGWPGVRLEAAEATAIRKEAREPGLYPDYSGITIPPNIAPLNFFIKEPGGRFDVVIRGEQGNPIRLSGPTGLVRIPARPWGQLLRANAGGRLYVEIQVEQAGAWHSFAGITNTVAGEEIDGYLVYRLLRPVYHFFNHVGLYERQMSTFQERPVLRGRSFGGYCVNCHTFLNNGTEQFALHVRTETKFRPMLLVRSNEVIRVDKALGYLAWHPSGKLLVFSANKLSQFFHTAGEARDLFDAESDLGTFRLDSNQVRMPAPIATADHNETWPTWAPDGTWLYYCSAPKVPIADHRHVRYDLMRVSYNLANDQWGEPETLVSSARTGSSATLPRVSPNGKYLVFCLAKYGNFPIWQPSSDLYLNDLVSGRWQRLDILNSNQSESWHSWLSNSHWLVFSSKRLDGLFARPHFGYLDDQGHFHKPFILPQEDPLYYQSCLETYNLPELVREPVHVTEAQLIEGIRHPQHTLSPFAPNLPEHREQ